MNTDQWLSIWEGLRSGAWRNVQVLSNYVLKLTVILNITFWFTLCFMASPTTGGRGITFSGRASGCPLVRCLFCFTWRDISVLSGRISMKLATNIHHASERCLKGFQGIYRSQISYGAFWTIMGDSDPDPAVNWCSQTIAFPEAGDGYGLISVLWFAD